ncbi:MAG: putative glycoside hydrolase [bacterium]
MKKKLIIIGVIGILVGVVFFYEAFDYTYTVSIDDVTKDISLTDGIPDVPEAAAVAAFAALDTQNDQGRTQAQKPLMHPPVTIKAIYATAWSAGSPGKREAMIDLIKDTELNAIVIDIKDYSGHVLYDTDLQDVDEYGAQEPRIRDVNAVIKQFHDNGIYVIARLTVFQDPVLAAAQPKWAVESTETGTVWKDNKGLAWMDPSNHNVWDYNISIAHEAAARGFDEVNFDYIRFPSDGSLQNMIFSSYDSSKQEKHEIIHNFFVYLNEHMQGTTISADLFGLATINQGDLGIGQIIEDAYQNFDYVSPMVYPSHYANGFLGYKNPAEFPHEVVAYSLKNAFSRLFVVRTGIYARAGKLRPWLQDFDMGADYDATKVKAQITAISDALCDALNERDEKEHAGATSTANQISKSCSALIEDNYTKYANGWMLWNPSNVYTKDALASGE